MATRGSRQSQSMSKTMVKVDQLQNTLSSVMKMHQEEKKKILSTNKSDMEELMKENESLKRQLKVKHNHHYYYYFWFWYHHHHHHHHHSNSCIVLLALLILILILILLLIDAWS